MKIKLTNKRKSDMNKPAKKTLEYYDWEDVEKYLIDNKIWSEELKDEVWSELCETVDIKNGSPFTITDWDLKHDNGKFADLVSDFMKDAIPVLLEHFGEPDKECLDPDILTATFIASW